MGWGKPQGGGRARGGGAAPSLPHAFAVCLTRGFALHVAWQRCQLARGGERPGPWQLQLALLGACRGCLGRRLCCPSAMQSQGGSGEKDPPPRLAGRRIPHGAGCDSLWQCSEEGRGLPVTNLPPTPKGNPVSQDSWVPFLLIRCMTFV